MAPDEIVLARALRGSRWADWSEEMHLKSRHLSPKQRRRLCKAVLARKDLPPAYGALAVELLQHPRR